MAAMEFYFTYDPDVQDKYEVKAAGGGLQAMFNCNAERLQKWGLWAPFVQEFRSKYMTFEEVALGVENEDNCDGEPFDEDLLECWGASQSYPPEEFKNWAARWIVALEAMTDEQAKRVFPFDSDLHRQDGYYGRDYEIRELRAVIEQAECAIRHGAKMTVCMSIG